MLAACGLRVTQARLDTVRTLLDSQTAMTHQQMQSRLPAMDRVTLYRTLDSLTDAGLAHRITDDSRVAHYRVNRQHSAGMARPADSPASPGIHVHRHGHFKCETCGELFCIDLPDDTVFALNETPTPWRSFWQQVVTRTLGPGFQASGCEFTVRGVCTRCTPL